jgi:hypothetical protein
VMPEMEAISSHPHMMNILIRSNVLGRLPISF